MEITKKIYEVVLEENSPRRSAAITDQKLLTADIRVCSIVKVYNKQLQHLSTIKYSINMLVNDISVDIHQNLMRTTPVCTPRMVSTFAPLVTTWKN